MARPKKDVNPDEYDGSKIKELPFPECVQQRPQMYIGTNDHRAFLVALREIVNNSVDEHLAGFCNSIAVVRHSAYRFSVMDNGRGVPFDKQEDGSNTLLKIFGKLHAGRNFEEKTVYSTGLNGVGASCVNAVSTEFNVTAIRGTNKGNIIFKDGIMETVKVFKNVTPPKDKVYAKSSTCIDFEFNRQWFDEGSEVDHEGVINLLRETAFLNSGLSVSYTDLHNKTKTVVFKYDNGIEQLLDFTLNKKGIVPTISFKPEVINDTRIEIALNYTTSFGSDTIASFCNTIRTGEGGAHCTGFKRAISQKLLAYVKDNKLVKEKIENEDIFNGLEAVVSVFVFNPKYSSQTKQKLENTEVNGHVLKYMNQKLDEWLATNPDTIKTLAKKFAISAKARIASKNAIANVKKEAGGLLSSLGDLSKFSDCSEDRSGRTELFLVEGDSAGGTASQGRDKAFQAIYRLRGKPLNVLDMDPYKAQLNKEVGGIVAINEAGAGQNFDIEKCKFEKIIALADADSDGKHIEMLLTTIYYQLMPELIRAGKFYLALSPLYRVTATGQGPIYIRDQPALDLFYTTEIANIGKFYERDDGGLGKEITSLKAKTKHIAAIQAYEKGIEKAAEEFNIDPHIFEMVFLHGYDADSGAIALGDTIEVTGNDEETHMSLLGFFSGDEEHFVCLNNVEIEPFMETVTKCFDLFSAAMALTVVDKKGNEYNGTTVYTQIKNLFNVFRKKYQITRLKGWGEASAEELWDAAMNPETRQLIRLEITDDTNHWVRAFMDSTKSEPRKVFLREAFAESETENVIVD